jgi:acetyltransferase-like isoleucine patch superfamily enzyme
MTKFISKKAEVHEANTFIAEFSAVLGPSYVGEGCFIGPYVVIGHPKKNTPSEVLREGDWEYLDGLSSGARIDKNGVIRGGTVVYEGAKLDEGVTTGHYALVRERSTVGKRSLIGSYVVLDGEVHVGEDVRIQTGTYLPHGTIVEDRVFFGPYVTVTNDKYPPSSKLVGVKICKNAIVGARAVLIAGVTVGENSIIGAGAVVTKDVPEDVVVIGVPARVYCKREDFEKKRREYERA